MNLSILRNFGITALLTILTCSSCRPKPDELAGQLRAAYLGKSTELDHIGVAGFSRDSESLVYSCKNGSKTFILLTDISSNRTKRLAPKLEGMASSPQFCGDGQSILVDWQSSTKTTTSLASLRLDSSVPTQILASKNDLLDPSISPRGDKILFIELAKGNYYYERLKSFDLGSHSTIDVLGDEYRALSYPAISQKGNRAVVGITDGRWKDSPYRMFLLTLSPLNSKAKVLASKLPVGISEPSSPCFLSENEVAFVAYTGRNTIEGYREYEIFKIDITSEKVEQISHLHKTGLFDLTASPNGQRLAFLSWDNGRARRFVLDLAQSKLTEISPKL